MLDRINLSPPHLFGKEQEYLADAMASNWIAPLGPYVDRLEHDVENLIGNGYCTAVASGTAALHLAVRDLGIQRGDYVFCSTMTFAASINPAIYEGATPVFIDSEEETYNMDPLALRRAFDYYCPKAVIVPHLYGTPACMEVFNICQEYGVPVIEDAAEVLGSTIHGRYAGTIGKYGAYSFNGNKIITGSAGGMVVSGSKASKDHILSLATQAKASARYYKHDEIGFNYRMSNIVAAIVCGQLETLGKKIDLKRQIRNFYAGALQDGVRVMDCPDDRTANYWLSVLLFDEETDKTERIVDELAKNNIEARFVWCPLHTLNAYSGAKLISSHRNCCAANNFFRRAVCLPSDTRMTSEDLQRVVDIINPIL